MITSDCDHCGTKEIPVNKTIKVGEKTYCESCFNEKFTSKEDLKGSRAERGVDPTICSVCAKDFGQIPLDKISIYPICKSCHTNLKNKTLPPWVKGFFAGILMIMTVGFVWNWRFYQAYNDISLSNEYFGKGEYENATKWMTKASNKVSEVEDLKILATYDKGVELLANDKGAEALKELESIKYRVPDDLHINNLIVSAKMGATFDSKDYKGFLDAAMENLSLDSSLASSYASVASAYACLYATGGNEDTRQQVFKYLDLAKSKDSTSKEMKDYFNKIEYRVYSRKIISTQEFTKQFPNGWTKN